MAISGTSWAKGKSANPGGRPKALIQLEVLARNNTEELVGILLSIARDGAAPHNARVAAINSILNRGWGLPKATVTIEEGPDVRDMDDYTLDAHLADELTKFLGVARIVDVDEGKDEPDEPMN